MYDPRVLRDNLNELREQLGARGKDVAWEELRRLTEHRRTQTVLVEDLRHQLKKGSEEVARLKRRPDVTVGAGWVVMDAPGAMMADAGRDSLMLSVSTTLPVRRSKTLGVPRILRGPDVDGWVRRYQIRQPPGTDKAYRLGFS